VVRRSNAALGTLKSVAALVALAVERERFLSERAHLHALRESDALKTSLLRAVKWETNFMRQVLPRRTVARRAKI